jgi:hypothetical protein
MDNRRPAATCWKSWTRTSGSTSRGTTPYTKRIAAHFRADIVRPGVRDREAPRGRIQKACAIEQKPQCTNLSFRLPSPPTAPAPPVSKAPLPMLEGPSDSVSRLRYSLTLADRGRLRRWQMPCLMPRRKTGRIAGSTDNRPASAAPVDGGGEGPDRRGELRRGREHIRGRAATRRGARAADGVAAAGVKGSRRQGAGVRAGTD